MTRAPGGSKRRGMDVFDVEVGGETLVVISFPAEAGARLDELTPAEREVALAVLRGLSNADVARERGCRSRTIAAQLASIYRKLGITSRAELAVLLGGGHD